MALGIIGGDPSRFIPVLKELTKTSGEYESDELFFDGCELDRVYITEQYPIV
jgi:hypothetical protein